MQPEGWKQETLIQSERAELGEKMPWITANQLQKININQGQVENQKFENLEMLPTGGGRICEPQALFRTRLMGLLYQKRVMVTYHFQTLKMLKGQVKQRHPVAQSDGMKDLKVIKIEVMSKKMLQQILRMRQVHWRKKCPML